MTERTDSEVWLLIAGDAIEDAVWERWPHGVLVHMIKRAHARGEAGWRAVSGRLYLDYLEIA